MCHKKVIFRAKIHFSEINALNLDIIFSSDRVLSLDKSLPHFFRDQVHKPVASCYTSERPSGSLSPSYRLLIIVIGTFADPFVARPTMMIAVPSSCARHPKPGVQRDTPRRVDLRGLVPHFSSQPRLQFPTNRGGRAK